MVTTVQCSYSCFVFLCYVYFVYLNTSKAHLVPRAKKAPSEWISCQNLQLPCPSLDRPCKDFIIRNFHFLFCFLFKWSLLMPDINIFQDIKRKKKLALHCFFFFFYWSSWRFNCSNFHLRLVSYWKFYLAFTWENKNVNIKIVVWKISL